METNGTFNEYKTVINMLDINATIPIITSNVSSLRTPTERQILAERMENQVPLYLLHSKPVWNPEADAKARGAGGALC